MKTPTGSSALINYQPQKQKRSGETSAISLQKLINQFLAYSLTTAFHNKSLVVNSVSSAIELSKDRAVIGSVIRDLLATVVSNARNGDICISADRFRDTITLQIQDRNNYNGYALAYSVRAMEAQAAEAGASIDIDGEQKRVITISLSFPNNIGNYQFDC
jgi:hypothetical protein